MAVGRRRGQRLGQARPLALAVEDVVEGADLAQARQHLLLVAPDLGFEPGLVGATGAGLLAEDVSPLEPPQHGRERPDYLTGDHRPLFLRRLGVGQVDHRVDVDLSPGQADRQLLQATATGLGPEDGQDHLLPRLLHAPGEFHLASRRQQRHRAHLAQVNTDRVLDTANRRFFNHWHEPPVGTLANNGPH